ncbi:hypothetical protein [Nocardioides mangrovi]|uniref:WD40 repeat domain-containing protein n=1 Tax=Nocardioides mangrovi TaxID=2874580 RepID=A0ABS7U7L0_9ACTN|nr:hypothetical protein [Nocardioides mangrovi]MBZ5736976.1 hypothetical protein [Nocardioides mangrovi]
MRISLGILTLVTALTAALASPVAAAPGDLHPARLPRGDDPKIPYVVGSTVIDGKERIEIDGHWALVLGRSGDALVVQTDRRVLRVTGDRQRRIARLSDGAQVLLSEDGSDLVIGRIASRTGRTTVRVLDPESGAERAREVFSKYVVPLGARGGRVVMTASAPTRTFSWNHRTGDVRRIVGRSGGTVNVGADRLGTLTGDPYNGGCYVVSSLRHPRRELWRSCEEGVMSFSPDGSRMVTMDILADGLGPGRVWVRATDGGRLVARYSAYWFSSVQWETDRALLLDTHTPKRWATLRCVAKDCERASRVRKQDVT